MRALGERYSDFTKLGAEVVGISVDSVFTHKAWIERDLREHVRYPILADLTKSVSRDYGVLLEDKGLALRGTFIVDPNGVLQFMLVNNLQTGRSIDEMLRTLQALQTGELCPADWRPGQPTLKPA